MKIQKIIDPLNLIYYEYDEKTQTLFYDKRYSNKFVELEFFKITYYLTKQDIEFRVLKDKSIEFAKKSFFLKSKFEKLLKDLKNNKKNIYLLNNEKVKFAKNIPLFNIKYIKQEINFSKYDALIFSSKNGVLAVDSMCKDWKKVPSYAISEQTAKLIKDLDGNLAFVGKKRHGDEFAYEILPELKGKKVLYLRAKEIVSDFLNILNTNGVVCDDVIVYENEFIQENNKTKLPKNSKIIFSSPSTIKYFFKVFTWDDSYTAISIGNTTAKYFPKNIKPVIAQNTSIQACVDKALEME